MSIYNNNNNNNNEKLWLLLGSKSLEQLANCEHKLV